MAAYKKKDSSAISYVSPDVESFEDALSYLSKLAQREPVSIRTFLSPLLGKVKVLLLIFICLPLGQIPGVAIGSGFFIAYLGFRMAFFNTYIWLPQKMAKKTIPRFLVTRSTAQLMRLLKFMKKFSKPRFEWLTRHPSTPKINGFLISITGLCIALAPCLPFCGYIAYLAIILISVGILNEDGWYILIGYSTSLFYLCFVITMNHFFSIPKIFKFLKHLICTG